MVIIQPNTGEHSRRTWDWRRTLLLPCRLDTKPRVVISTQCWESRSCSLPLVMSCQQDERFSTMNEIGNHRKISRCVASCWQCRKKSLEGSNTPKVLCEFIRLQGRVKGCSTCLIFNTVNMGRLWKARGTCKTKHLQQNCPLAPPDEHLATH